jgi:hypothetical protein
VAGFVLNLEAPFLLVAAPGLVRLWSSLDQPFNSEFSSKGGLVIS